MFVFLLASFFFGNTEIVFLTYFCEKKKYMRVYFAILVCREYFRARFQFFISVKLRSRSICGALAAVRRIFSYNWSGFLIKYA